MLGVRVPWPLGPPRWEWACPGRGGDPGPGVGSEGGGGGGGYVCVCWPRAPGTGLAGTPSCLTPPPHPPPLQCECGDPPLRKVPIFRRGMKSFLIPAQNRSLREPAREGAFGQGPSSLMGPAAGAGCSARPWGGSWAGLFSWPCPRDLAGHHQPRTPLTQSASHLSAAPAPLLPPSSAVWSPQDHSQAHLG